MGNETSSRGDGRRRPVGTAVKKTGVVEGTRRPASQEITREQLEALDPRIREWVVNPNYTVVSQTKSDDKTAKRVGGAVVEAEEKKTSPSAANEAKARRSADGILTIKTGREGEVQEEPEMKALRQLGLHMPLRYKSRLKTLFPPEARTKSKRIELDPIETYKLLQHYQMRLNESSLRTMERQEETMKKISQVEHSLWQMAHTSTSCGLALNALETHISEAWNLEKSLAKTRMRLGEIVKRLDSILSDDMLRDDVRQELGPIPFTIAPQFTAQFYIKLNYFTLTPFYQLQATPSPSGTQTPGSPPTQGQSTQSTPSTPTRSSLTASTGTLNSSPQTMAISSPSPSSSTTSSPPSPSPSSPSLLLHLNPLEKAWLNEILPFWEIRINSKRAQSLWRKGIPPRLRAFVWQRAIGNRLGLTREMYHEALASQKALEMPLHSDPDYITANSSEIGVGSRKRSASPTRSEESARSSGEGVGEHQEKGIVLGLDGGDSTLTATTATDSATDTEESVEIDLSDPSMRTTDPVIEIISTTNAAPSAEAVLPSTSNNMATIPFTNEMEVGESGIQVVDEGGMALAEQQGGREQRDSSKPQEPSVVPIISPSPAAATTTTTLIAHTAKGKNTRSLIVRDSLRTFSKLGIFRTPRTPPHEDLVNVLHAVSSRRADIGYVQGQSFLAGVLLMYMPADEAFVALANLLDHHFFKSFGSFDLANIRLHVNAFEALLKQHLPLLFDHFKRLHLLPEHYLFDWYVTLFAKPLPLPKSGLIWDCYLMEGPNFIPRITVAILKQFSTRLIQFNFEECMKLLQQLPDDLDIAQIVSEMS